PTAAPSGRIAVIFVESAHGVVSHAAASSLAAGANGSATGYFRGRPLGLLRATMTPETNSSPPQTPHGSRRFRAPAKHAARTGQSKKSAFASSTSAGASAKNRSGATQTKGGL